MAPWKSSPGRNLPPCTWPGRRSRRRPGATLKPIVAGLAIEYVRDRKKVIDYAVVRSASGLRGQCGAGSAVSRAFPRHPRAKRSCSRSPTAGPFMFSQRRAGMHREYAPMIFAAYRATAFPVTTEVFELSSAGLRAVGDIRGTLSGSSARNFYFVGGTVPAFSPALIMKKVLPVVILLLLVAIAAWMVMKRPSSTSRAPRSWRRPRRCSFPANPRHPENCAASHPDRTLENRRRARDAEVPGKAGERRTARGRVAKVQRALDAVLPREGFVALTSIDGPVPTGVAGFAYSGSQKEAEALIAEWRAELRKSWPAGTADLSVYGKREIETFATKDFTFAEVFTDGWYLIADNLVLLQQTIDRLDRKGDVARQTLAKSACFQGASAPRPCPRSDVLLVAQLGPLMERLISLLTAAGSKDRRAGTGRAAQNQSHRCLDQTRRRTVSGHHLRPAPRQHR